MNAHGHGHDHEWEHDHGRGRDLEAADERRHEGAHSAAPAGTAHVFRAAATGRADVVGASGLGVLQRAAGNGAVGAMVQRSRSGTGEESREEARSPVHDVLASGGGQPLDTDTRIDMETRMGADFSDVRVHNDAAADSSAKGLGAHAYTVGSNVVFTHVVQQRSGPVEGTEAPGGIRVSDPSDRFEQEAVANADRVMADPAPAAAAEPVSTPAPASAPAASVQRRTRRSSRPTCRAPSCSGRRRRARRRRKRRRPRLIERTPRGRQPPGARLPLTGPGGLSCRWPPASCRRGRATPNTATASGR
jgi:hypothetical protein